MNYVYIVIGHRSFKTGKSAIVAIAEEYEFISDYANEAKKRVCKELGLNVDEAVVLTQLFLGNNVLFL